MNKLFLETAKRILPASAFFELRDLSKKVRRRKDGQVDSAPAPVRKDVVDIDVQPNVRLVVFWKDLTIGKGPAVSLVIHEQEVMKFDCFGPEKGHFHVEFHCPSTTRENRIYFFENTTNRQIERSIFEIKKYSQYYIQRHPCERIRKTQFSNKALQKACDEAQTQMLHYSNTVSQLQIS